MKRDFQPDPASVRMVRRFVEEAIPQVPNVDDIVLAASELASNVVQHAKTPFKVRILLGDELIRLEVSDGSSIIPAIEDLVESYRGLLMIESVSERWGAETTETGKTIWAEFNNAP